MKWLQITEVDISASIYTTSQKLNHTSWSFIIITNNSIQKPPLPRSGVFNIFQAYAEMDLCYIVLHFNTGLVSC